MGLIVGVMPLFQPVHEYTIKNNQTQLNKDYKLEPLNGFSSLKPVQAKVVYHPQFWLGAHIDCLV
jgi:hypothetical protein